MPRFKCSSLTRPLSPLNASRLLFAGCSLWVLLVICQSAFSQAEANQAEVNQAEANQGEANQGEANQAEANQGEANQTEVNQPKPDPQVELMNRLVKKAKQLSQQAYQPTARVASDVLKKLNYDEYRSIRFDAEKSLWRHQGLFEIQFFHPGFLYSEMIGLRAMDQAGLIRELNVDVRDFTYGNASLQQRLEAEDTELSYSGFRVHFPVNTKTYKDEIAVFLGASYFRLVGPGQVYGLSARGLAINTAESSGEEFPRFSDFWLVKPAPDCATLIIYALLDSPSVTGLYRFELSTDVATRAHVDVQLFSRTDIKKIGLAPLTSMFFFGEAALQARDDFRHEVHDSDGLLMHTSSDKWIWRPITNPRSLQVTSLHDHNPRGFGLVQRDRDFDHYLDVESHYQNRPSLWVEPQGEWGEGFVELVEIPTDTETNDNITAYWVPKQPFRAGESRQYSYTLSTFDSIPQQTPLAQVSRTLIGWGANPGQHNPPPRSQRRFVVDFEGGVLDKLPMTLPITASVETSSGEISDVVVNHLPEKLGWRVVFRLQPAGDKPADMRVQLKLREKHLSEEWSYVWYPNNIK